MLDFEGELHLASSDLVNHLFPNASVSTDRFDRILTRNVAKIEKRSEIRNCIHSVPLPVEW